MYGFKHLKYVLPQKSVHIKDLIQQSEISDTILINMFNGGLKYIPIHKGKIEDLIIQATQTINMNQIGGIVYAQSLPFKSSLFPNVSSVRVSGQPCAILHLALKFAINWRKNSSKDILLIGADKAVPINEKLYFNSAMGDVVIVGQVSKNDIIHKVISINNDSYIFADNGELSQKSDIIQFRENNPLLIRENILINLKKAKLKLDDIKYIFPHTPYLKIWDLMANVLKYPREKIVTKYINITGHLNSNDSFFHYLKAIENNLVKQGDIVLLINNGFGGSRGSTILQYKGK